MKCDGVRLRRFLLPYPHQDAEVIFHQKIVCAFSRGPVCLPHLGDTSVRWRPARFCFGIGYRDLVCGRQMHSSSCALPGRKRQRCRQRTALPRITLITDQAGVPLAVFTADCLSAFLYDTRRHACGMVHAGWRSTRERIVHRAIERMREVFGSEPADLTVGFGPCMRSCCLEVGEEFRGYFDEGLIARDGRLFLDLAAVNARQLIDAGVKKTAISDSGLCTSCRNDEFFSFRREGEPCGRMMSVIMLR
jgi:YfiH family protein